MQLVLITCAAPSFATHLTSVGERRLADLRVRCRRGPSLGPVSLLRREGAAMRGADVSIQRMNTHTVVAVTGEMDLVGKLLLVGKVDVALEQGAELIVINLSGVTFLDAQGLSALVVSRVHAAALHRRLALAEVPAMVRRLLKITNLHSSFAWVN